MTGGRKPGRWFANARTLWLRLREQRETRTIARSGLFDRDWYLDAYPDVAASRLDPLIHYLRAGAQEGRNPGPLFETKWYVANNPDVVASGLNPLQHYVTIGEPAGRQAISNGAKRRNLAIQAVTEKFSEFCAIEPEIADRLAGSNLEHLGAPTAHDSNARRSAAWRTLYNSLGGPYQRMIFVASGEPDRIDPAATTLLEMIQRHDASSTLMVATEAGAAPDGARGDIRSLSAIDPYLTAEDRKAIVSTLVYYLQPNSAVGVDSAAYWQAASEQGVALSARTNLYGALSDLVLRKGAAAMTGLDMKACMPRLREIYVESDASAKHVVERYALQPDLQPIVFVLKNPAGCSGLPAETVPPGSGRLPDFLTGAP